MVLFLLGFLFVFGLTWGFFISLGPKSGALITSRAERDRWIAAQTPSFLKLQNTATVLGTLTSFATVLLFYLAVTKQFGYFTFFALVTLFLSYPITNWASAAIIGQARLRRLSIDADQSGAVLASLFWSDDKNGRAIACVIKYVSLIGILGVIWLEFAVLFDVLRQFTGISLLLSSILIAVASFVVAWFTFEYGIRGFVFADVVQAPIILLSFLMLFAIIADLFLNSSWLANNAASLEIMQPQAPLMVCFLFVLHVFTLNLFLPVVMEVHWLRLWSFKQVEIGNQRTALATTVAVHIPLILAGFAVFYITGGLLGEPALIALLHQLADTLPIWILVFWIAASAALFSTADSQLYAATLVWRFDVSTGGVIAGRVSGFVLALAIGLAFGMAYGLIRYAGLPFEKIIFTVLPSVLILLAPIIAAARQQPPSLARLLIAAAGFYIIAAMGFYQDDNALELNLLAALFPVAVALFPHMNRTRHDSKAAHPL